MLQLLPSEAIIFEKLKVTRNITQVATEIGMTREAVYLCMSRMIGHGAIQRSGTRRNYVYTPIIQKYEIVSQRIREKPNFNPDEDDLLQQATHLKLTKDQLMYLKLHGKTGKRSELAKRLGLTKMQLNFALIKLEGRKSS